MSETHGKCTENARETHNALHEWREYVRHAESGHNYATMSGLIERAERAIAHFRDRAEQAEADLAAIECWSGMDGSPRKTPATTSRPAGRGGKDE